MFMYLMYLLRNKTLELELELEVLWFSEYSNLSSIELAVIASKEYGRTKYLV